MSGAEDILGRPQSALRVVAPHREFLPAALEILDTPPNPAGRAVMGTICVALVVAIIWSSLGQVDIVATAQGVVIPAGKSKTIQPLEAGVLRAIRVEDGDHVVAGQVLFELDQTVAAADRDRIARDLRQARLDAAGLRALAADLSASGFDSTSFIAPEGIPAGEVAMTRASIEARAREQAQKCAALEQQIEQKTAEAAENDAMVGKLAASLPMLLQKRDIYRALLHDAFSSKVAWLDSEQAYSDQMHQLAVQQVHAGQLTAARQALVAQLSQTRAGYAHDVLKDLAEAEQKEGELAQQYAAAAHKAEETVLAAPISGTVQALAVHTLGGVVTPAEALLTLVPDDGPVLVEATVENDDIGFVHAGQDVEVKVRTFEFTRYGLLHGHVVDVSRDRVAAPAAAPASRRVDPSTADKNSEDERASEPGYLAHVALDRPQIVVDGRAQALSPGMALTAEIRTGRRSVISYLLSPLQRYANEGVRER
jgi:hemolysin D